MGASDAFDPAELELRYPVWTLFDTSLPNAAFPDGICQVRAPEIGLSLMIFRDADMAARFADKLPRPSVKPMPLQFPQELIDVAEHHQKIGTTHVGVNFAFRASPEGGTLPPAGRFTPITNFIKLIRTNLQDPPPSPN